MSYSELIEKANRCRENAIKSESKWAQDYWMNCALALEIRAANLPLCIGDR